MSAVQALLVRPARVALALSVLFAAACSERTAPPAVTRAVGSEGAALTAAQCDYFAVNGTVRICHATGSAKNPFTVLNLNESACINAHAGHGRDYVASNDPTCSGRGFLPPNAPCDGTLTCETGYTCNAGLCKPTNLCAGVTCGASDQCHVGYCEPSTGHCVNEAKVNDFPCDDANACTRADACQAGVCVGANPVVCSASDQCHSVGTCATATGTCSNPPASSATTCDDANPTTYADHCNGTGQCSGTTVNCPGSTQCLSYGANGTATCTALPANTATACDDGSTSTCADHCDGTGSCVGSPVVCPANTACTSYAANGTATCSVIQASSATACDDGSPSTYADHCSGTGACIGTTVTCPANTACTSYAANGTATCSVIQASPATTCNDGSTSTYADHCSGTGACVGTTVTCPANTACTSYAANGTATCSVIQASPATSCNDGSAATYADHCDGSGSCVATTVTCPANTACTSYAANGTATCTVLQASAATTCDDGSVLTYADHCSGSGACIGSTVTCPAATQCTTYAANGTATCTVIDADVAKSCDDESLTTYADHCDGSGVCVGANVVCPANEQCTSYEANGTATCSALPADLTTGCDDENTGTYADFCDGVGSCVGKPVTCPAATQCTSYAANGTATCSVLQASTATTCNDSSASTYADHCDGAGSCVGSPVVCPANSACTSYAANGTATCFVTQASTATTCDDGSASTYADHCDGSGTCTGATVTCPAATHCTSYAANGTATCTVNQARTTTNCDDGSNSTYGDHCDGAGACIGGPVVCPPNTQCTTYVAVGAAACAIVPVADGSGCDDGDACTLSDICQAGACTGSNPVVCAAADQCHVAGSCDPSTGACSNPASDNGTACNDGNACTRSDTCQDGACTGANPVTCSASDQCHAAGTCDPSSGSCSSQVGNDGASCSALTGGVCGGGTCGCPAGGVACGGVCLDLTADVNNCGACGNVCTGGATCVASACTCPVPAATHAWTFNDGTSADSAGTADGTVLGGASINSGFLQLDNTATAPNQSTTGRYMKAVLPDAITGAHTLVSWVKLANLTQRGGSALTIEKQSGNLFDAVDFGETTAGQWIASSDNFARTLTNDGGALETSTGEVEMAIVYDASNGITLYRNGQLYAPRYVRGTLQGYPSGSSDVLLGLRHGVCGGNCWLSGDIDEARVYGSALNACQIAQLTPITDVAATVPGTPAITSVTSGPGTALVEFTPPTSNGGATITSYTVTASPGGLTATGSSSPILVTGLTNGVTYTFTVTAANALGSGGASSSSAPATLLGAPSAPRNVVASVAGVNNAAVVTFDPPTTNGGLPVTSYTVSSVPPGFTATAQGSPITVVGLSTGVAISFVVTATNAAGTGSPSGASAAVTPTGKPSPPVIFGVNGIFGGITVNFAGSINNGGLEITRYTCVVSPGGLTQSTPYSPIVMRGVFKSRQPYTVTCIATNSAGDSLPSTPSRPFTVLDLPKPPLNVVGYGQDGAVSVVFDPSPEDGGSPVEMFTVTSSPFGWTASGTESPILISNLTNGQQYTFTVTAHNQLGTSAPSLASVPVTPSTTPGQPTIISSVNGDSEITLQIQPPPDDGGSFIIQYNVFVQPGGGVFSSESTSVLCNGLDNNTPYTFTAMAINANGNGIISDIFGPEAPVPTIGSTTVVYLAQVDDVPFPGPVDIQTGYALQSNGEEFSAFFGTKQVDIMTPQPIYKTLPDESTHNRLYVTFDNDAATLVSFHNTYIDLASRVQYDPDGNSTPLPAMILAFTNHNTVVDLSSPNIELNPMTLAIVAVDQPYTILATPPDFRFAQRPA